MVSEIASSIAPSIQAGRAELSAHARGQAPLQAAATAGKLGARMVFGYVPRWLLVPAHQCLIAAQAGHAADIRNMISGSPGRGLTRIQSTLTASAQLATLNGKSAISPFALVERARENVPRLQTALDGFGYYLAGL